MKKEQKEQIKVMSERLTNDFYEVIRALALPELETLLLLESFHFLMTAKFDTYEHRAKLLTMYHYIVEGIICEIYGGVY